jgi:putative addiction module component (TIGR02574 family)
MQRRDGSCGLLAARRGRRLRSVTKNAEHLLDEVLRLPEQERAEIAAKLIESLEQEVDADVDGAWADEIERRCAALDAGQAVTSDWNDVRRRIEEEIFRR